MDTYDDTELALMKFGVVVRVHVVPFSENRCVPQARGYFSGE